LNLAFVANLFNNFPTLDPNDIEEDVEIEPYEESREEKSEGFFFVINHLSATCCIYTT